MSLIDADQLRKFYIQETPSGSINGSNTGFTLTQAPLEEAAVLVFLDGQLQLFGTEISLSGVTLTFTTAPATGQKLLVQYVQKKGGS